MATRELLTEWHQKASLNFASRLILLRPRMEQQKLDFIRDTLMKAFAENYFVIGGREITNDEINWLKSLLMVGDRFSAVKALYEITLQLRYCERFPSLWKEFKRLRKNPRNLRSFFFELFIYKTLDEAGIATVKKPKVGKQVLEGYCTLNDQQFLFECKQPYVPTLDELFLVQRLMNDFHQQGYAKSPLNGYIAAIYFHRPLTPSHRSELGSKITTFYEKLPHGVTTDINEIYEGVTGRLEVCTFSEQRLQEIEKTDKADVVYYLAPTGEVRSNGEVKMEGKVVGRFNILRDKLYQKLQSILQEEKEQHPLVDFPRKIVFVGSESFPEFQFGLFQHDNMYDLDRIVELCNTLELGCIVCFVRKYYQTDRPYIKFDAIAPQEFMEEAKVLKHLFDSLRV